MKKTISILFLLSALTVTSCISIKPSTKSKDSSNTSSSSVSESSNSSSSSFSSFSGKTSSISSSSTSSSKSSEGPEKVTVSAHTLKDSNPPIDIEAIGDVVDKDTWESFRNGTSKFQNNYNYTYTAYSGGNQTIEQFTKDGYFMRTNYGRLYYERKNGNTFYNYISTSEGYLREETTLDIKSKYTYRIENEIYLHMFDFENYEYDDSFGVYRYYGPGFTSNVMFQGGYLTYLFYVLDSNIFQINATFDTTIDIPESYYYK